MRKREGLQASAPNQYLHVDTTHIRVDPDNTLSVAIVSDNFSKAVLGTSVALNKGAANVLGALRQALATIRAHYPNHASTSVVCDGGSENKAALVTELLLSSEQPTFERLIARQDITFSNSPVEAVNKILKGYLRCIRPQGVAATRAAIEWALNDYTHSRPHGSIDGLTPWERYLDPGHKPGNSAQRRMAQVLRIAANRGAGCGTCE